MLPLKCPVGCSKEGVDGPPLERSAGFTRDDGGMVVARALRNHNVWLVLTYVGLILLMARAYA